MKKTIYFFLFLSIFSCTSKSNQNIKPGNLEFYETYFISEISLEWQQACLKSMGHENKEMNANDTVIKSLKGLKGLKDYVQNAGEYAIGFVNEKNKKRVDAILQRENIKATFPKDLRFMWSAQAEQISDKMQEKLYTLYAIKVPANGKALISGKEVKSATVGYDTHIEKATIDVSMSEEGQYIWADMTSVNIGRIIAITMDNVVYSAPRVMSAITGGNTQISGDFSAEEAVNLAARINAKK